MHSPNGVQSILGRVTGGYESQILGELGVDGTANLFLLNPNGIMFGPNVQLDIEGSFLATTAEQFTFADGETFSAISPEAPPLLTVSLPLGLQLGATPQATITSTGHLETGKDLILLGNQLYLEGQLIAGHDLRLQAEESVTIRDTETAAFIARSGNDLTIQGNQGIDIWTLQHLDHVPFSSGRDLALISDGDISGDAHFESGGHLQFLTLAGSPGNFVSYYDPIIFANGDVVLGDYTGVALKVEALGSIQAGKIEVIGPDTTLTADGTGSDEDLLASSSAAILRAGVGSVGRTNIPQTVGGTSFTEGLVINQPPGSIVVDAIKTISVVEGGDGGPIILAADGNITTFGNLDSLSRTPEGSTADANNGGDISISSIWGDILINGKLSSFSQAIGDGNSGRGGDISIFSQSGNITTNHRINSFSISERNSSGNSSNAGNISISSMSGDISINERLKASSAASSGNLGNGGDISISSISGNILITKDVETFSESFFEGDAGTGGDISISSTLGTIVINGKLLSFSKTMGDDDAGRGGDILIFSQSGNITTNNKINSFSISERNTNGNSSNAGNISISSISSNISINDRLNASSTASFGNSVDGGNISIASTSGDILIAGDLETFSESFLEGDAGTGGDISISSISGNIQASGEIEAFSISRKGNAGNGGNINIFSESGDITTDDFIRSFSFVKSEIGGESSNSGDISISTISGDISTNGRLSSFSSTNSELSNSGSGNGGNIFVNSISGDISTSRIDSSSTVAINSSGPLPERATTPAGDGGNISISSVSGNLIINENDGFLVSSSISRNGDAGNGGDISLITREGRIVGNSDKLISTVAVSETDGNTGAGGTVTLEASSISDVQVVTVSSDGASGDVKIQSLDDNLLIRNLSLVTSGQITVSNPAVGDTSIDLDASTFDQSGMTTITSAGNITFDNVKIISDANRSADAGNVEILSAGNIQFNNGSEILSNANAGSSGNGGNVSVIGSDSITLNNSFIDTATNGLGRAGSIRILTPLLTVQNGARITAATSSTGDNGIGGDIGIEADKINFSDSNTDISVSTSGLAAAGSITLKPLNSSSIEISTINDGPQFAASTVAGSSGRGGNIIIRDADIALLRNTELITSSDGSGDAGNIIVENVDVLLLRQGSLIQAGASANGNGGNIDIDATLVVAVPNEDNDILADTNAGTGGNIDINADAILGFREVQTFSNDLRGNALNDISARSASGIDGNVTLTTPDVTPDQGLLGLPVNLTDQSGLITQRCLADNSQGQSTFAVTGQGGLPPSPSEVIRSETSGLIDLGPVQGLLDPSHYATSRLTRLGTHEQSERKMNTSPPLVEAQGWMLDETGTVQLMAQIPNISAYLPSCIDCRREC